MKKMMIFITVCLVLCAMTATFPSRPCFADPGKKEMSRDIALGQTAFAKQIEENPWTRWNPAARAIARGLRIAQAATLKILDTYDKYAAAPSSPDPACCQLAVASPVSGFDPVDPGIGAVLAYNLNKSQDLLCEIVSNSRALDLTLRRYYGAIDAGKCTCQLMQQKAATSFVLALEQYQAEYAAALVAISDNVQGTEVASLSVTVSEVLALRDEIVASGQFPPEEDFVFEALDATQAEIDGAIYEVSLATGETLSDSDLTGAVIFQRAVQAFLQVNIRELLPQGFQMYYPYRPYAGQCFIATAAYGSPLAEELDTFREFRDDYLLTNPIGSRFVSLYYEYSPPVAQFIEDHPILKPVVRTALVPPLAMATVAVKTTLAQKVAIVCSMTLVGVMLGLWLRRKAVLRKQ
jgi:hypothetical protein